MIYLITGQPGSGKTLHMVSMLKKRKDLQGRPLYVDGIPDLDPEKIPHEVMPEGCHAGNWHEWLPTNAILVVDEAQRYWRPRANGSAVPDAVKAMETHRHRGVDLFLITQHPRLLDINVRSFVENHKHVSKGQLGNRRMWEWQKCANPDSKGDIRDAIAKTYVLDKSVYDLYKSAEVHTKIKTSRNKWFYLFPIVLIVAFGLIGYSVVYLRNYFAAPQVQHPIDAQASTDRAGEVGEAQAAPYSDAGRYDSAPPTPEEQIKTLKAEDFQPSIDGKPWTAPAYAPQNTQIATMPYPVGCVQNGDQCTCYTDQATPIQGMDKGLCIDFVQNGIYNPYKSARSTAPQAVGDSQS